MIDIGATARKHEGIVRQLPAAHALYGCDTMYSCGAEGKALEAGHSVRKLCEVDVCIDEAGAEAAEFIAACYGNKERNSMFDVRKDVGATKMGKPKVTTTSDPKVLSPTTEAFEQNVQTAIWKSAVKLEPPTLDPTKYGWARDEASRSLTPVMLPPNVALTLSEVLEMIRCGCSWDKPCYTAQCRRTVAKLPCLVLCACWGETGCRIAQIQAATTFAGD